MAMALTAWDEDFAAVVARLGPRFARAEARRHAADYLRGLLGRAERKNGWQLAEAAGDATPYGLQQFLYRGRGIPTRCATTCAPTWSSGWAIRRACWSWTKPGS